MSFIMSSATLNKLAKGVDAKFLDVFVENEQAYKSSLASLFKVRSSDKKREHTKLIGGAGKLKKKDEGDSVQRTDLKLSYETEFVHDTFANGVTVTMENIQDRDYADKLDEFAHLARSARYSMDEAKAQVFNGGFATTVTVNGYKLSLLNDGKPLFSTVHPLQTGATASNASSTGAPLNASTLEAGRKSIMETVADDGTFLGFSGKLTLVVPPALRKTAVEITKSELDAASSNNAVNVFRGEIDVMECTFLGAAAGGSDTAWYLVGADAKLIFIERLSPSFDMTVDGNTKDRSYDAVARWSVGHADWRFTYGSSGTGAAYSS
jgi:phage major head subunit gpT-like protein